MWHSTIREEIHRAAKQLGCDFAGLGLHSLRRANISWRQEVGASSIEASRIAGPVNVRMTEEYTFLQLKLQEELTRRIQGKLATAKKRSEGTRVVEIKNNTRAV